MLTKVDGGVVINGLFEDYLDSIGKFPLIIADPPYGNIAKAKWDKGIAANHQIDWLQKLQKAANDGTALYWFGGWGKYRKRVLFETLSWAEFETDWHLQAFIPWVKKKAYGVKDNYLAAMEYIAYFTMGKKPAIFNKPYLDELRTCREWTKYKCHDKRKRRTMFWGDVAEVVDVTEILRGKNHECEKPVRVYEIPIETHTNPGDRVFDPFGGSGVCGSAAKKLGREFVIIEKDKDMCEWMIKQRFTA